MKMTQAEKFLLALMITGCLTVTARAADRIENPTGSTIEINGETFSDLSYVSNTNACGAAVYNEGTIGSITGSFTENHAQGTDESYGGAIYSEGTIGSIAADFTDNYAGGYQTSGEAFSGSAAGGAIYIEDAEVESITGNFSGNYAVGTASATGGAIHLSDYGKIATITGNFTGNYVEAGMIANGGAIYITDEISLEIVGNFENNHAVSDYTATGGAITDGGARLTITGDLKNNYVEAGSGNAEGGAIYYAAGINEGVSINGNVTGNHAASSGGSAYGGALVFGGDDEIIDQVNGDITGNWAKAENGYAIGGALYNSNTTTVVGAVRENYAIGGELALGGAIYTKGDLTVTGDFSDNYAIADGDVYGGAVAALSGELGDMRTVIIGDFKNNYALSTSGDAMGGAVLTYHDAANSGTMTTTVIGDFTGNFAQAENGNAMGGAVYNSDTSYLAGDFSDNHAMGANAYGGAIYNEGTIGTVTGNFSGNYVSAEEEAYGGAIYNEDGTISSITGSFTGNYAQGEEESYGGAIYSEDGELISSIEADFTGNYAGGYDLYGDVASGAAAGGAIYLDYTEVGSVTGNFTGNYAVATASANGGAIYLSDGGVISTITGNFTDNYVEAGLIANGGAIYIADETFSLDIDGNFENNHATSNYYDASGGAIFNWGAELTITGNLKNNYVEAGAGNAYGGAIYAQYGGSSAPFVLNGNVTGNHASSSGGNAYGGALVLAASRSTVSGDIIGNWASAESGTAIGGAIYNGSVTSVYGALQGNYAVGGELALGGAIYTAGSLTVTGGFTGNYAKANGEDGIAMGGAIAAVSSQLGNITNRIFGNFQNNYAESTSGDAYGGAVCNYHDATRAITTTTSLVGDFSGNYAVAEGGKAMGGAVYNSDMAEIVGNFTGNYAQGLEAYGGAIYNGKSENEDYYSAAHLMGNLTGNFAQGENKAFGGAICNEFVLMVSEGVNLKDNYASSESGEAKGGAIYNVGVTCIYDFGTETYEAYKISLGDVTGNYAEGATEASGGAIYNKSDAMTIVVTGSMMNNHASATGSANGGAIWTTGDVEFVADGKNIFISGNYTEGSDGTDENAVYMAKDAETGETGTVEFKLSNGGSIYLYDNVRGEDVYGAKISGDGLDTTFYLFNDLYGANVTAGNTTLNTVNSEIHKYSVNSFTLTDDVNFVVDVDLENEEMDRISAESYGEHNGTLTVSGINGLTDTSEDSVAILFAEDGLKESVTSSAGTVYAPIYRYDTTYDIRDDGGYLVFDKAGFNPAVMATSFSAMGVYNAFGLMYEYNFEHSDYFMKLPENVRLALAQEQKKDKKAPKENDATRPEYYNRHELTERGAWFRSFFSNESVPYRGEWNSRDKYYGAIVGFDSDMHVNVNGWANVTTGYVGSLGIRQNYGGGRIKQHGAFIGVTESFYKKNFYTAWTAAAGLTKAHEYTMYGQDASRNTTWGVAGKFGWNFQFANGVFALIPTFTASYTTVDPEDYVNAADVKLTGSGVRAVQLNPNVKFVVNLNGGWQPYLTVGEIWTVGGSSNIRANGVKLDELELRPYTEYGIGVQKRWANERDAYVQLLGHSHGRDGILVGAGIRWNF